MKDIFQPFKTSWCEFLNTDGKIAHFFYKIEELKEEVRKRTSYLGKYRGTENIPHLLEQLSMTKDEEDIFMPFLRASSADVFDTLIKFTQCETNAYQFNEKLVIIPFISEPNVQVSVQGSPVVSSQVSQDVNFSFSSFDFTENSLSVSLLIKYQTYFTISGQTTPIVEDKEVTIDFQIGESLSGAQTQSLETITFYPELSGAGSITSADSFVGITGIEIIKETYKPKNPVSIEKGTYIEYGGKYYMAVEDTDSSYIGDNFIESKDYSNTVHYILSFPSYFNENGLSPSDIAIFECLVNLTIFKWLLIAYKEEAQTYYEIYLSEVEKLRSRLQVRCKKVNIIPRPF